MLPIGGEVTGYQATITGSGLKRASCENCQKEYAYFIKRTAVGVRSVWLSKRAARDGAETNAITSLQKAFEKGCEPVPCPHCGWYQDNMVRLVRSRHRSWMNTLAIGLFVVFVACSALAALVYSNALGQRNGPPPWSPLVIAVASLALAVSIGLVIGRRHLARQLDPNADDVEERLGLGRALSASADQIVQAQRDARALEGRKDRSVKGRLKEELRDYLD